MKFSSLILCFFGYLSVSFAYQTEEMLTQHETQSVQPMKVESGSWEKAVNDLDFGNLEKKEKPKPEEKEDSDDSEPDLDFSTDGIGAFLKVILILLAVVVAGLAVYVLMGNKLFGAKNRKITTQIGAITLDELEDKLEHSDVGSFLDQALRSGNYALAIRLQYLAVMKELTNRDLIRWKKDKTNGAYLREMAQQPQFGAFRDLTRIFENVWYGKKSIDRAAYERLAPSFSQFLQQLNTAAR